MAWARITHQWGDDTVTVVEVGTDDVATSSASGRADRGLRPARSASRAADDE